MKLTLNPEKLQELFEIDDEGEVLKELISLFIPGTEAKLLKLEKNNLTPQEIKGIAHEMRSSSANLGAERLSDLATQLEYLPQDAEYANHASEIVKLMVTEFEAVKAGLTK